MHSLCVRMSCKAGKLNAYAKTSQPKEKKEMFLMASCVCARTYASVCVCVRAGERARASFLRDDDDDDMVASAREKAWGEHNNVPFPPHDLKGGYR